MVVWAASFVNDLPSFTAFKSFFAWVPTTGFDVVFKGYFILISSRSSKYFNSASLATSPAYVNVRKYVEKMMAEHIGWSSPLQCLGR